MSYIIERTDQGGGFVADLRVSNGASYTHDLRRAKQFATRDQARDNCCPENEIVLSLEDAMYTRI